VIWSKDCTKVLLVLGPFW